MAVCIGIGHRRNGKDQSCGSPLSDFLELAVTGVKTGANSVFVFDVVERGRNTSRLISEDAGFEVELENDYLVPYLKAESLKRYRIGNASATSTLPVSASRRQDAACAESEIKGCPKTWRYLQEHRHTLEGRQKGKLRGPSWYGLSFSSSLSMFRVPKIVTPTLSPRNSFSLDADGLLFPQGAGGGCGLVPRDDQSAFYLLGLLNSRLLTFYFQRISSPFQGGWFAYEPRYLSRIPVFAVDPAKKAQVAVSDRISDLAESMLTLHSHRAHATSASQRDIVERQIDAADIEIDRLVCGLYGLSGEELALVERSG